MDARINPLDEQNHVEIIDVLRRSDFTDAVVLFDRLVQLAYKQGQIDAFTHVIRRVSNTLEDDINHIAREERDA